MDINAELERIGRAIYTDDYASAYKKFKEYFDAVRNELPINDEIDANIEELKMSGASMSVINNREKYWHDYISNMCGAKIAGFLIGYTKGCLERYESQFPETHKDELYESITGITKLSELEALENAL